jgi:hypothetical protein
MHFGNTSDKAEAMPLSLSEIKITSSYVIRLKHKARKLQNHVHQTVFSVGTNAHATGSTLLFASIPQQIINIIRY